MGRREDIEAGWLLRPFRMFRVDPTETRMWAILLAVLIGIGLTLAGAYIALARISSTFSSTAHTFVNVRAYNQSVTQERAVVMALAGFVALSFLGLAWWCRRRAAFYAKATGVPPGRARLRVWLLIAAAAAVVLGALAHCLLYLTHLPVDGPSWRHL